LEEIQRTGGVHFEDMIDEIERRACDHE
jgi:hypothetical protein